MSTAIHRRVASLRAGNDPTMVARLSSGWAVLGDPQVLRGYCLLLPDPVVPTLNDLDGPARRRFLDDMAALGDAVLAVTGALRINYAMFGNVEPALHAHVFPRYAHEPEDLRKAHPWAYDWSKSEPFDLMRHAALRDGLREALARAGTAATTAGGGIHHLDLTVSDLVVATAFYDRVLPTLGFRRIEDAPEGPLWAGASFELGLQAARRTAPHDRHAPGLHHLAFAAPTRADVDRAHGELAMAGVVILDPPDHYPQYCEGYYAFFFEGPDGVKLEYVHTPEWPA
ncbi:MAG: VOC family protein [Steroidobacteraceae bacterium]|jgi:diadenosine tetraphosphate (Ap4A) HIT family hydrolase/catechol 2,3-dioxygenase-like lactoylglutathione lyase family enzyme|nr:VOC family protein [Steroidobacteraceae bacterium]